MEPTFKEEARKLRYRDSYYLLIDDVLYKQGHLLPLLKCLDDKEANYMLKKIYKGICGNHFLRQTLTHKVLRQGYY